MSEYGLLACYGTTWTHNTGAKPTGAQAYIVAQNNGSDVVVQGILKNKIRIYANMPPRDLAAMLNKYTGGRSIHLHEIVCGDRPAKVYFDYDKEIDESADAACHTDILNEHRLALIEKLRATLGEGIETRVSGSIGKNPTSGQLKVSIHLVLHNRFTASLPGRKALRGVARALGLSDIGIGNPVKRAVFERDAKCIYLINPMGGGKSKFALAHIKSQTCGERSIFFTSRQALAKDVAAKAKDGNVNLVNYLDYNLKCEKKLEAFVKRRGVIMQQESMHHLFGQQTYNYVFIDEFESFLNKHEKLFGYYPYINPSGRHKSIIEIAETACKLAGKNPKADAVLHHGKMDLKAKTNIMADVNRTWLVPLVMCNSAVTCGVSFTEKWFTKSFIAKASWNNPRDLVQFSFRVRNLGGDNTIDISQLGGSISPKDSKVLIADDPVYRGLIADVNFEQSMTGDDCFRYLCGKVANFEVLSDDTNATSSREALSEIAFEEALIFRWGSIAPLDRSCVGEEPAIIPGCDDIMSFKEVERRINARDATTAMQLSMEKFYFEVMFKPCTPKGSIVALWDNGRQNFVKTLYKYLQGKGRQSGRVVVPDLAKRVEEYMEAMIEGDRPSFPTPPSNEESKRLKAWTLRDCFESGHSTPMKRLAVACESFFGSQIFKYENKDHRRPWVANVKAMHAVVSTMRVLKSPSWDDITERRINEPRTGVTVEHDKLSPRDPCPRLIFGDRPR
eukprot:jgi/Tetstr1/422071/TSEL_012931.t1